MSEFEIFEVWNDCTGCFEKNTGYYYEIVSIIEDEVKKARNEVIDDILMIFKKRGSLANYNVNTGKITNPYNDILKAIEQLKNLESEE